MLEYYEVSETREDGQVVTIAYNLSKQEAEDLVKESPSNRVVSLEKIE